MEVGNLYHEVEQRVEEIFRSVDINNDGKISRTEFLWAMTGSPEFLPRSDSRLASRSGREGGKPRRHNSMSSPADPNFLAMSKRAASTNDLPVNPGAPSTPTSRRSHRSGHIQVDNYARSNNDSPHSPPNFRGILARNQINALDPHNSTVCARPTSCLFPSLTVFRIDGVAAGEKSSPGGKER